MARPSTAAVTTALTRMEAAFVSARTRAVQIEQTFRSQPSDALTNAQHTIDQHRLRAEATLAVEDAATAAEAAFTTLLAAADDHVNATKVAETETPAYAAYLRELTAQGALLPFLTEAAAVAKLQSAVDDGRLPQARALYDLISARFPMGQREEGNNRTNITAVLHRAGEAVVSPSIEAADDFATDMKKVYRNYRLAASGRSQRLEDCLNATPYSGGDLRANNFAPRFLFGSGSPWIAD